jgi:hypothetical protein
MTRWAGLRILSAIGALAAAACYPDYQFSADQPPSGTGAGASVGGGGGAGNGPVGGQGGIMVTSGGGHIQNGGNGAGGFPTTSSSGGSGAIGGAPVVPQVNCDAGTVLCAEGQVCCFDDAPPYSDVCGNPGACPANYYEMKCDDHGDCASDSVCCGTFVVDGWGAVTLTATSCKSACSASERPTCTIAANCSSGTCDEYWEGYKFCNLP